MLALSASDIEAASTQHSSELTQSAIYHRILAIRLLNCALSTGLHSFEEGNAMIATLFNLVFQSMFIDEGHSEYLTFIRGGALVAIQMGSKGLKSLFQNLVSIDGFEMVGPELQGSEAIDLGPIDAAYASLAAFGPLCKRESEKKLHGLLLELVCNLYLSLRDGMKSPLWV
jgi:hypothetical protein